MHVMPEFCLNRAYFAQASPNSGGQTINSWLMVLWLRGCRMFHACN